MVQRLKFVEVVFTEGISAVIRSIRVRPRGPFVVACGNCAVEGDPVMHGTLISNTLYSACSNQTTLTSEASLWLYS